MPDCLVDTNIWLRLADPAHEMFPVANSAVRTILGNLDALYLCPQVIGEFWRVATSPVNERGGFGWSPQQTDRQMQALEYIYPILHDGRLVYGEWRQIM